MLRDSYWLGLAEMEPTSPRTGVLGLTHFKTMQIIQLHKYNLNVHKQEKEVIKSHFILIPVLGSVQVMKENMPNGVTIKPCQGY